VRKDLRRVPRYAFIATAELIEQKTDVRIATRVSELSLHGCYLDMMNPFPPETFVLVKIAAGDTVFQARAKIVYVQPNLGAGVAFLEIEPENQTILQRWLEQAKQDQHQRVT
jgi:PilZ domain